MIHNKVYLLIILFTIVIVFPAMLFSQESNISEYFPEIQILESNGPAPGYYFMGSKGLTATNAVHYIAIIDNYGTPVFFRKMNKATSSMRLLPDGRIAYLHGVPRKLYFLDDMLEVADVLSIDGYKPNGHDWDIDQNGHVLLMGESTRIVDMSQLVVGGNPEAKILDLVVQEFDAELNLLYTWNSADYFDILDGNENSSFVDYTKDQIDHVHANGISIDSDTSFLISCRHMEEITKIDRRTGEIIWRLGGKNNQFEFINDPIGFSHQHSIRALENGKILLFDNGNLHDPQISSSVEYQIDELNKTATLVKRYYRDQETYSNHQGSTQRIANGNTLINWGPYWPSITEFFPDGSTALEWDFTLHSFCPRTEKYIWKTKIFELSNDTMIFDTREESNFFESEITVYNNSDEEIGLTGFSSHTPFFKIDAEWPVAIAAHDSIILDILFEPQDLEIGYVSDLITIASDTENQRIAQQVVVFGIKDDDANPIVEFGPDSTNVPLDPLIYFNFNEPVFGAAMLELNNENIDGFIEIRKNNSDGEKVHFDAVIDTENKKIKIRPGYILEGSTTYSVILKDGLYDYSGNVKESLSFDFVTTASTNTDNPKKDEKISIFPNPSSGSINIMNGSFQDRNIQVTVYSLLGTLIFERKNINLPAFDVEIRSVKSGIYILKINSNNGDEIYSEKLLIKKN